MASGTKTYIAILLMIAAVAFPVGWYLGVRDGAGPDAEDPDGVHWYFLIVICDGRGPNNSFAVMAKHVGEIVRVGDTDPEALAFGEDARELFRLLHAQGARPLDLWPPPGPMDRWLEPGLLAGRGAEVDRLHRSLCDRWSAFLTKHGY